MENNHSSPPHLKPSNYFFRLKYIQSPIRREVASPANLVLVCRYVMYYVVCCVRGGVRIMTNEVSECAG